MNPESLITTYGYAALFVGAIFEGETFLVTAVCLAAYGYLEIPQTYLVAVSGAVAGDQFFFYVGRCRGRRILKRKPDWERRVDKVYAVTRRYHSSVVLALRFLYGFRMVLPFSFGLGGFRPKRFFALDLVSALIWAAAVSLLGYVFCSALGTVSEDIRPGMTVGWIAGCCLAAGGLAWLLRSVCRRLLGKLTET